jgi:formyl-CoA transferase
MTTGARVLDGTLVLELGQVYNGPYCALLLAHLGATVVKVEPPGGEPARHRAGGQNAFPFLLLNAGKRGICLDLKSDADRRVFLRLVERADVVVENFRAGVLERLDLGYARLRQANPRIILASGRGFNGRGPYRDLPAMDLTVQAMTGLLAATGFPGQPPVKAGAAVADFLGGAHLLAGVLAALLHRERTGEGQVVEVAMQDALLPSLASNLGGLLQSGSTQPERTGNRHAALGVCPYNVYPAQDGWVALLCASDRQWSALCDLLGRADLKRLANAERVRRMDEIDCVVESWTSARTRAACVAVLTRAQVPHAPVLSLGEVVADPQLQASGMLRQLERGAPAFGNPIRLSASPAVDLTPAPGLGEHTRAVLEEAWTSG